jgi:hypothetical protein
VLVTCIHSYDFDGRASAALVRMQYPKSKLYSTYIPGAFIFMEDFSQYCRNIEETHKLLFPNRQIPAFVKYILDGSINLDLDPRNTPAWHNLLTNYRGALENCLQKQGLGAQ